MSEYHCILWGGYAWGNVGDELTLAVALHDARQLHERNIAIISPHSGYTRAVFPNVEFIPYAPVRRKHRARPLVRLAHSWRGTRPVQYEISDQEGSPWVDAIRQSKSLYLVGGGYLNDLFNFESFLLPARIAKQRGVPIQVAPLGIGPFRSGSNERLFAETFGGVALTVRDEASLQLCRNLRLSVELRSDDGFRAGTVIPGLLENRPEARNVGLNFHAQAGDASDTDTQRWSQETLSLLRQMELPLEGFCFHNSPLDDFSTTAEAFAKAGLDPAVVRHPRIDFREACLQLGRYRVVVTSRFHAVIVAGVLRIPALAVANGAYYKAKMQAACAGHPCGKIANIQTTTPAEALVVFVDDDNELALNYLSEALVIADTMPEMGAWGGDIAGELEISPPDKYAVFVPSLAIRRVTTVAVSKSETDACPYGAGLCVRRHVVAAWSKAVADCPLRRSLGRAGSRLMGGEDLDLALFAHAAGLSTGLFPQLHLTHLIARKRLKADYLFHIYVAGTAALHIVRHIHGMAPIPSRKLNPWKSFTRHFLRRLGWLSEKKLYALASTDAGRLADLIIARHK